MITEILISTWLNRLTFELDELILIRIVSKALHSEFGTFPY
jgi:hypothetical protein